MEQKFNEKMRVCTFSALYNALDSVSSLTLSVRFREEWVDDELLFHLLNELKFAHKGPHEAYLARKCLVYALEKSATLRENASKMGASNIVLQSIEPGHCIHHLLGRTLDRLLQLLGTN